MAAFTHSPTKTRNENLFSLSLNKKILLAALAHPITSPECYKLLHIFSNNF